MWTTNTLSVQSGDLWAIGPHRFLCADALTADLSFLPPRLTLTYTDPPWSPSFVRRFYRAAGLPAPTEPFTHFLRRLIRLTLHASLNIYEMGQPNTPALHNAIRAEGGSILATFATTYGSASDPRPSTLTVFRGPSADHRLSDSDSPPRTLHGPAVPRWACATHLRPHDTFFDPCAGQLLFVKEAASRGAITYGCEIIPGKLATGLLKLGRFLKTDPTLVRSSHD